MRFDAERELEDVLFENWWDFRDAGRVPRSVLYPCREWSQVLRHGEEPMTLGYSRHCGSLFRQVSVPGASANGNDGRADLIEVFISERISLVGGKQRLGTTYLIGALLAPSFSDECVLGQALHSAGCAFDLERLRLGLLKLDPLRGLVVEDGSEKRFPHLDDDVSPGPSWLEERLDCTATRSFVAGIDEVNQSLMREARERSEALS